MSDLLEASNIGTGQKGSDERALDPIEALGKEIVGRIEAGDRAQDEADGIYKEAGQRFIEARSRVENFRAFLTKHCNGLKHSRAYELIAIAEGSKTLAEVRAKTNERVKLHRAAAAKEAATAVKSAPADTADEENANEEITDDENAGGDAAAAKETPDEEAAVPEETFDEEITGEAAEAETSAEQTVTAEGAKSGSNASVTKRTPQPQIEALAQFKVAADIWMAKMGPEEKRQALAYVAAKAGVDDAAEEAGGAKADATPERDSTPEASAQARKDWYAAEEQDKWIEQLTPATAFEGKTARGNLGWWWLRVRGRHGP